MKPCASNRQCISLLVVNGLEAPAAGDLRAHLEACAGCRQYYVELSRVAGQLIAAEPKEDLRPSDSFRQTWMDRVKAESPARTRVWEQVSLHPFQGLRSLFETIPIPWRIAFSVMTLVVFSLRIWIEHAPPSAVPVPPARSAAVPAVTAVATITDLSPTLANYQRAASQSFDKLDDLLFRQENPAVRTAPVCTASATSLNF